MKYFKSPISLILLITLIISCNKEDGNNSNKWDCVFEQIDDNLDGLIDDTERMIMNTCRANALSSKSSIESNLIGEWELIGHGEGWVPFISQPCGYIKISEAELTFEFRNENTDTFSQHQWEIEELNSNGNTYFRLNILPEFVEGLSISQFCESYMFGDATPSDGNMYLYRKVE